MFINFDIIQITDCEEYVNTTQMNISFEILSFYLFDIKSIQIHKISINKVSEIKILIHFRYIRRSFLR